MEQCEPGRLGKKMIKYPRLKSDALIVTGVRWTHYNLKLDCLENELPKRSLNRKCHCLRSLRTLIPRFSYLESKQGLEKCGNKNASPVNLTITFDLYCSTACITLCKKLQTIYLPLSESLPLMYA